MTSDRERPPLWYAIAAGIIVTVAASVRFGALDATLFEDEVWVAYLLRDGDFAPHSYSTPPLFYWIGRIWVAVRGMSDSALREPAAFFGTILCAVPFFAPRPPLVRLIWAALLAFSSPLLFYSGRLKQYTLEAFVITVLIVLFLHAWDRERAWWWFFAVAIGAVMTLHAPIFCVAAMGAIVLLLRRRLILLGGFALVAAAFVAAWFAYLAPGRGTEQLYGSLDEFFAQTGRWIDSPSSLINNTLHWTGHAFNLVRFWWLAVAVLVVWLLIRARDWRIVLLAALPPMAVIATSLARVYPYGEVRLMIFCFPALYLLAAEALEHASRRAPLLLLLLAPYVFAGLVREPYDATYMRIDDLRQIVDTIRATHRPGEPIYADPPYAASLRYYAPELQRDLRDVTLDAPVGPGWYVQRDSRFRTDRSVVKIRARGAVAARIP